MVIEPLRLCLIIEVDDYENRHHHLPDEAIVIFHWKLSFLNIQDWAVLAFHHCISYQS